MVQALVPLSGDNGIFDLTDDETAKPRSARVRWLSQAHAAADLRAVQPRSSQTTFSLEAIDQYVAGRATR